MGGPAWNPAERGQAAYLSQALFYSYSYGTIRAGWGVFIGYFVSMLLKLIASGVMTFFFIKALVR